MKIDVAIIGGTGIGSRLAQLDGVTVHVPTPEGYLRGRRIVQEGKSMLIVQRHSAGHKVPPHRIAYRAIALGLKSLGVKACLSSAAVGSLRNDWGRGTMAACSDFIDLTSRRQTLFDRKVVHTDFSEPMSHAVIEALTSASSDVKLGAVYVCGDGPRYETPFEIKLMQKLGGDVVGMTAGTEAILMREAGIPYGCLAIVTNLAAGLANEVLDHMDVVREMDKASDRAVKILLQAALQLA